MSSAPLESTIRPRYPKAWLLIMAAALMAVAFGAWCYAEQQARGFIVTGMRNPGYGGGAWGMYIAFDVFFVGVSFAGITVSALARLFGIEALKPATRLAELVTITALLAGGCVILADLGRPWHGLMNLPRYARPQSPFYGTFTLVIAGYLFSSFVFFVLSARKDAAHMSKHGPRPLRWFYRLWASGHAGTQAERRRHHIVSFWLSVAILPLLVTAHSTLGFIFGIQAGRPGWFGSLQAPGFVVLAGVSGTGMVIVMLAVARKLFGLEDQIPKKTLGWLVNFMATLALVYLYFMAVDEITSSYAAPEAQRRVAHTIVAGRYAPLFWITVGCLVLTFAIPFFMRLKKIVSIPVMVAVGLLANVAAVCKRMLIVVPSQTDGALISMEHSGYHPTYIEYGIVLGLFGLLVATVVGFGRVFPLVPSVTQAKESADDGTPTSRTRRTVRFVAAGSVAAVALVMIVLGLADSFRLFRNGIDPVVPGSPLIFAFGIMLLFTSAVVYEVFPREPAPVAKSDSPVSADGD